jgi:hypothetical protein
MSISGYLLPFPDPGAADLMSDHLEQVVQATGPGKILVTTSLPEILTKGLEKPSGPGCRFARKKLEFFRLEGNDWIYLSGTMSDSGQKSEEVILNVQAAETVKCKLTNMSGREGQFSLECSYEPRDQQ